MAALAATSLCLLAAGPAATSLAWTGVMVVAILSRVMFLIRARWAVRVPVVLFVVSQLLWAYSDALRTMDGARAAGSVAPTPELLSAIAGGTFCIVIVWAVYLRGRPRIETWLDAGIFLAALAPALWLLVIEPGNDLATGAVWIDVWALTTFALMFTGGLFLLSGGIWNAPSIALVLGVIGSVVTGVALRLADPAAPDAAPHFLAAAMAGAYVARHPDLDNVFVRGGRPSGISLDVRVWMLACVVALPVGTLGFAYVRGDGAPIASIAVALAAIAITIGARVVLLARAGVPNWSAPLNISFTALLVSAAAVSMSLLNQSAQDAQRAVDHGAALLPEVRQLDGLMLRGVRRSDPAAAQQARREWRATVRGLQANAPELAPQLDAYRASVDSAFAASDRNDVQRARDVIDGPAATSQRQLSTRVETSLARLQTAAEVRARSVRLFSVSMLALTLLTVAGLLLRFNAARRRIALQHQATHDEFTGLPNRAALDRELNKPLPDASGSGRALLLLDLDDFKAINDSHGRHAGDAVIATVARRLEEAMRSDHMVIRLDGDAFGVLVPPGADALIAAQRALGALATPIEAGGEPHLICASVGIADVDEDDPERHASAFRDAELAMYQAKHVHGSSFERFSADMDDRVRGRIQLLADLRGALDGDAGLHLAYQPIVDLEQGGVAGYEALIRWTHPTRGPLSPADFIPIAEESGLIVELGAWVLRTATQQLAAWQQEWNDRRYVSVNVAGAQFTTRRSLVRCSRRSTSRSCRRSCSCWR